ncbi:MAG TPA: hypothetical protein G4O10_11450 [Dehalococcoidia bacterium]|nr:hypothetical protein [Dehalococcoidia bacterium]
MDWGFIGVILAIIFFILMLIVTIKYRRVKKLVWSYETKKLIGIGSDSPPELRLMFGGEQVSDVYRTNLIVVCTGSESLRKNDVTEEITMHFKGAKILRSPSIVRQSNDANEITTDTDTIDDDFDVKIDFIYLDYNDGAVVEVLHTKYSELSCSGNVIGVRTIKHKEGYKSYRAGFRESIRWRDSILPFLLILAFGFPILIAPAFSDESIASLWEKFGMIVSLATGMLLTTLVFGPLATAFSLMASFPKWSVIKG